MPAATINLEDVVLALAGCTPPDRRIPADLETVFAYNALLAHGWPGIMVVRSAPLPVIDASARRSSALHYFLRLGANACNARGEGFDDIWVNGLAPGTCPLDSAMAVLTRCTSAHVGLQLAHKRLYGEISSRIGDLVKSRWSSPRLITATPAAHDTASPLSRP